MSKGTRGNDGKLLPINNCYIQVMNKLWDDVVGGAYNKNFKIIMDNLPDISDSKGASYQEEAIPGRSSPFKGYSHSENRAISWTCHFITSSVTETSSATSRDEGGIGNTSQRILEFLRILESCTYPKHGNTFGFTPPPLFNLKCGEILGKNAVCAVLKNYSVKFDPSVPWDVDTYIPYKLDVDLQFEVVYNQSNLPGQETIMKLGV